MNYMVQFLYEVKGELSKIVWPKKAEFWGSTIVVLLIVAAFSVYLGLIDIGFSKLAKFVLAVD